MPKHTALALAIVGLCGCAEQADDDIEVDTLLGTGSTCPSHTGTNYYVREDAAGMSGVGSSSAECAFKTINQALDAIGHGTGTIFVDSHYQHTGQGFSREIFGEITIKGWVVGSGTIDDNPAHWPTIGANSTNPVFFFAHSGRLAYFNLSCTRGSGNAGVTIDNAGAGTVQLDHLNVTSCDSGIRVRDGGDVLIKESVHVEHCGTGLEALIGSRVHIEFSDTVDRTTHFNDNDYNGIHAEYPAAFVIDGPDVFPTRVGASGNGTGGLWYKSSVLGRIDHFRADDNGRHGIAVYAPAPLEVRNSTFQGNSESGFYISPLYDRDVSRIDLGRSADPGRNTFSGNGGAGICYDNLPSPGGVAPWYYYLDAAGNTFGSKDCRVEDRRLSYGQGFCNGGIDIGHFNYGESLIDVSGCDYVR